VAWWSVNLALVVRAATLTPPAPAGVCMLGVVETRARRIRWLLEQATDETGKRRWRARTRG
jgi:hypothetical protein